VAETCVVRLSATKTSRLGVRRNRLLDVGCEVSLVPRLLYGWAITRRSPLRSWPISVCVPAVCIRPRVFRCVRAAWA